MSCATPGCSNTNLVHSGVDATMIFEIQMTGKYCYPCAAAYITIKRDMSSLTSN